jgi:serine/threonine protein kinase
MPSSIRVCERTGGSILARAEAGKTLDQSIPRKGMRLNEALRIAVQIAGAMTRAHAAGIIYRDLKPANVMVDEHGQVTVLDFGLAKLTEQGGSDDASTV